MNYALSMKSNPFHKWLALVSLGTALVTSVSLTASEAREELHETYPLDNQGKVQLANVNGNVRIVTWDREEIKVDAIKRAKKPEHLDEVKIEIDAKADRIRIKTRFPDSKTRKYKNNSTSVDYTLTVPGRCHLDGISTVNGAIEIEKVGGDVKANSVNGQVTASGLTGDVDLSTVNGSVKASFAALKKDVWLKSVNGGVSAALPPDANADVSASTVNGGISSDFSIQTKKHFPVGKNLDGKLGQGGPKVAMSTVNGGIRLDRSKPDALEQR